MSKSRKYLECLPFVTQKQLDAIGLRNIERMELPGEFKKELRRMLAKF